MLAFKPPHGQLTPQCAFHNLQPSPQVTDPMKNCLTAIVTVLEKQYRRYFDLDVTNELRKETESARCHNIDAEQRMKPSHPWPGKNLAYEAKYLDLNFGYWRQEIMQYACL
jgi:hypothetical protein